MQNDQPLSRFTLIACYLTFTDPDVLQQCPYSDHQLTQFTFLGLIVQFVLILFLMSYSLTTVINNEDQIVLYAVSLLIALTLYVFEVRMISSDWSLSGVLKQQFHQQSIFSWLQNTVTWLSRLTLRTSISYIIAIAMYSIPIQLKLQEGPIKTQMIKNQKADNTGVFEELKEQESKLLAQITDCKKPIT